MTGRHEYGSVRTGRPGPPRSVMLTETNELIAFHSVVKHSSFAKAAEELALSPSGVSRIVTRLEERLGVRLVQRTTRSLALTEAGAAFYARASQILADLQDAEAEVQKSTTKPRGTLRLSAPVVFGQLYVTPLLEQVLGHYPELSIDLTLTNRFVDLIDEGIDLAIRIGSLSDSRLIARRLCSNQRVLVAAPSYLARRGIPTCLEDLAGHDAVIYTGFTRPREWSLIGPDGPLSVAVSGRLATNNVDVLHDAARRGVGITVGPIQIVYRALLSGDLVRVLPQYEFEPSAIFAVYPSARQLSTKVRAVVDFLVENFDDPPIWEREIAGKVDGFPTTAQSLPP
jgi:DNA-binding transcriptional LysR family regulator